ncbi:ATP-dependent DNA ligase [Microbacterium sp. SORGH_AS_0862]|uniref:DUF7882 family protein n=1 Tax=Microbacterium sp. SORGH_AS_0862 TaxID=3041789 RepID=UPI002793846E|nr:ATP-dependent DNA ligase [Microbacterium sp. SORGH_AS_0862]MDQ1205519.1 hypothetical protein [Microbacterium sp. SORGH_AS_0862]
MGKLIYDQYTKAEFEDRTLAHLQQVIFTKLRRNESFALTWKEDVSLGSGRTSVWLHPNANVQFKFFGTREPALNRAWLEALAYTANGPTGLYVVPEPAPNESPVPTLHGSSQRFDLVPAD